MFADIVGYTAMMQQDESSALIKLNAFKDALKKRINEFNGELIQYFGDGGLVIFNNSTDAVNCATGLQEDFQLQPCVPVRIGIHLGDILYKEGNIFGDCVNITSRIESMGVPGAVLVSGYVQKQLKNKTGFILHSLGSFDFKNVDEPMEIFALAIKDTPLPGRDELNGKFGQQKIIKSIAVLPFVNMSNDPDQEYFGDGIAEEIINSLVHLKNLHVAGRTSSFQFKGTNTDLREVGKKLNVNTVLEGSVRKQANKLRITVQLISVDDGYHLWSERYDREIDDVFAIQDEIALTITEKLRIIIHEDDRNLIVKSHTQNTAAYELYLKGRFYMSRRGPSLVTSLHFFQEAIELDPAFALAHSAYADAILLIATYGLMHPQQAMIKAKQSAEKAMELDPSLCQPYCCLGYYYTSFEWNWAEAKRNFLRSIELNPRYAEGHFRYGWNYLTCVEGNFTEAIKHGEEAIRLEPLSSICYATHSLMLHCAGKFDESLKVCNMGIELDAYSFVCLLNKGMNLIALKQYEEAIKSYEAALSISNRHHFIVNALIWAYCVNNRFNDAQILMNELKERSKSEYIAKAFTALSAAYLGNLDESVELLSNAIDEHDPILVMLKYEPWVPGLLRKDNRFKKILQKIGFPGTK